MLASPETVNEPDTQLIWETVRQYIDFIAPETEIICVGLLVQGAFDQVYNVAFENKATGLCNEFAFRIVLPINPHYKTQGWERRFHHQTR